VRVVADTNVLVSALIFPGGAPEAVYRLALEGRIELITSRPLLTELGRILTTKFGWEPNRAEEAVAELIRIDEVVEPQQPATEMENDPSDDRVLEAALEGGAEVIVSGDRHLLALGAWRGIAIERPAAVLGAR
jgi:putative PIN family toxin of toxin-antitoxin system